MAVMASFATSCWTNTKRQTVRTKIAIAAGECRMLEGIETQVHQNRYVRMVLCADPSAGLADEAILEIKSSIRTAARLLSVK